MDKENENIESVQVTAKQDNGRSKGDRLTSDATLESTFCSSVAHL